MLTRALLRTLRNDLPMAFTLRHLGQAGPYFKCVEGRVRFVCLHCGELLATVNPRNNLAHCFNCGKNINNIDLLLASGYDFKAAVAILKKWLRLYQQHTPVPVKTPLPRSESDGAKRLAEIMRQEFGNDGPPA